MTKASAQRLVVAGMVLQLATAIGVGMSVAALLKAFGSLAPAGGDATAAAKEISKGLETMLRALAVTRPLGLIGLALMGIGISSGPLRQRWVYRWSCVCLIPWILTIGVGTLIGLAGLIALFLKRHEFSDKNNGLVRTPEPTPGGVAPR